MVSQCTKFESSRFTRYELCMAVQNAENGVVWGSQGALKVMCNATIRQRTHNFLFDFNRNRVSILYRFRDIPSYLLNVADFDPPNLHLGPAWGDPGRISRRSLASDQSPWAIVWCCFCDPTFRRFSRTPTCDGQMDRHRAMASTSDAWHRAVKTLRTDSRQ